LAIKLLDGQRSKQEHQAQQREDSHTDQADMTQQKGYDTTITSRNSKAQAKYDN
jgi:hypothetical protein